jgi:ATP-binding cassette subfamily B protein
LVTLFSSLFTLIGVLVTMFVLNVWLALVTLVAIPIMIGTMMVLMKRIGPAFRSQQGSLGKLNGLMEENLSGQRVFIAYNQQGRSLDEFEVANNMAREAGIKAQALAGLIMPLSIGLNNLSLALVVGVGAVMVLNGFAGVTIGLITTFTNYARQISQPLTQITNLFSAIIAALAGAERIFETLDTEPTVQDKANAPELAQVKGDVVFEHVDFSYVQGTPILKDVSLSTKSGEMVALVGPTGAGKTTIINVLTRFYDIENGRITIDGAEIRNVQQDSLRHQLGIVLQDTYLFADTVMENIRYGRLDASDEEIFTAARLANADGFIKRLPDGYDTMLSERASNLSQGQRQLLAIARAILANPRILILDEATSSVDTRTEKLIQNGLHTLMDGRTSFVIAHRLSTIREADQILVIDDGQIVERGTHKALLARRGFYYDLYMSQFKGTAVAV